MEVPDAQGWGWPQAATGPRSLGNQAEDISKSSQSPQKNKPKKIKPWSSGLLLHTINIH